MEDTDQPQIIKRVDQHNTLLEDAEVLATELKRSLSSKFAFVEDLNQEDWVLCSQIAALASARRDAEYALSEEELAHLDVVIARAHALQPDHGALFEEYNTLFEKFLEDWDPDNEFENPEESMFNAKLRHTGLWIMINAIEYDDSEEEENDTELEPEAVEHLGYEICDAYHHWFSIEQD